eukprot:g17281.t1
MDIFLFLPLSPRLILSRPFSSDILQCLQVAQHVSHEAFIFLEDNCVSSSSMLLCCALLLWSFFAQHMQAQASLPNTLVIVTGNIRGGLVSWESLRQHVLLPLQADLMVVVGMHPNETRHNRSAYLLSMARFVHLEHEHDDWGMVLDQAMRDNSSHNDTKYWEHLCGIGYVWLGGLKRPGCYQQARSASQLAMRWLVHKLIVKHDLYSVYQRYILTRTDYLYFCAFPAIQTLDPAFVWNQDIEGYEGYSDRVTVMSSQNVKVVLDWARALTQDPHKWSRIYRGKVQNFEMAWKFYVEGVLPNRTKFFKHPAVIVAHERDHSTWSHPIRMGEFKGSFVQPKKTGELRQALQICGGWANLTKLKAWVQNASCDGIHLKKPGPCPLTNKTNTTQPK